jgi:Flp pilus assembly protein TadG
MIRRIRNRRGAAAVELAALLPFLAYIAVIGTDWARLFYYTIAIDGCARAGALYASDPFAPQSSPYPDVTAAALASAPKITPTPTVTSQSTTVSGAPAVQVTVSVPFTTITRFPGVPNNQTLTRSVTMRNIPANHD